MNAFKLFSVITDSMAANETLYVESSTPATFVCHLSTTRNYPGWAYRLPDINTSTRINFETGPTFYVKEDRLSWEDNKKDLILSAVTREDEGLYECAVTGVGLCTIQLIVRGK